MHPIIEQYQRTNQFGLTNGLELNILAPGSVVYTMPVQTAHLALPSTVHGGIIAGLMDAVISVAGLSLTVLEEKVVGTVEFKINYLLPAKPGDVLTASGKVLKAGKRLLIVSGEIHNQKKERIAIGTGTLNSYPVALSGIGEA